MFDFEKLQLYQKSLVFIDDVYLITNKFPRHELYGLSDQFRRAACSIALNIGEGSGGTKMEFKKFLRYSKRSIRECVVCVSISERRNYISKDQEIELRCKLTELSKMNAGLSNSI